MTALARSVIGEHSWRLPLMRRRTSITLAVVLVSGLAPLACGDVDTPSSLRARSTRVAPTSPSSTLPVEPTTTTVRSAAPTTTATTTTTTTATLSELHAACSRVAREPIDALRDQRQLHRLAISDTFDTVACYAAVDMVNRSDWKPSFEIDPALCPGKQPAYAVADTLQQVVEIAWVSDVLAGPYDLPIGVATTTRVNSAGGWRSLAVVVFCR